MTGSVPISIRLASFGHADDPDLDPPCTPRPLEMTLTTYLHFPLLSFVFFFLFFFF